MRLDGFLSGAGLTRKQAKDAIAGGRATVNGKVTKDPGLRLQGGEDVALDGEIVRGAECAHLMLNKPQDYVTARTDAKSKAAMDLLPVAQRQSVGPIGRLDKDATGLLLFTGDGSLAHRLISPKRRVEKRYRVEVEGRLTEADVQIMSNGIRLKDFTCLPAQLFILKAGEAASVAEIVVFEGKYHQVKRMFGALGHRVTSLMRTSIGGVDLDPALAPGESRSLTREEVDKLYAVSGLGAEEI